MRNVFVYYSLTGSSDKSPLPYGNFKLRDATVHSILTHPRYGPRLVVVVLYSSNILWYIYFLGPHWIRICTLTWSLVCRESFLPMRLIHRTMPTTMFGLGWERHQWMELVLLVTIAVTMKLPGMSIHIDIVFRTSGLWCRTHRKLIRGFLYNRGIKGLVSVYFNIVFCRLLKVEGHDIWLLSRSSSYFENIITVV